MLETNREQAFLIFIPFNMPRKIPISTDKAPASAAGLYNQAVVVDGLVYCSGALPVDVLTGKLIDDSIQMRTVS